MGCFSMSPISPVNSRNAHAMTMQFQCKAGKVMQLLSCRFNATQCNLHAKVDMPGDGGCRQSWAEVTLTMRETPGCGGRKSLPETFVTSDQERAAPSCPRSVDSPTDSTAVLNDRPGISAISDSV